jgi:hypothetical protein
LGKRSSFERVPRDFYPTPKEAVLPLLPYVPKDSRFYEPCYGNGALAYWLSTGPGQLKLENASELQHWKDVGLDYPEGYDHTHGIQFEKNALELTKEDVSNAEYIITNPPWERRTLHALIEHFRNLNTTWLLFDADWMHTRQASEYLKHCDMIVSVGRVKWIPDSKMTGKDNCAWYRFRPDTHACITEFVGR